MIEQILLAAAEEAAHAEVEMGLLGTLGINWKLFLAQLVNFGIVLFVFWKWVVKPLGKTLTDRQARIESGLNNANLMEKEKAEFDVWKKDQMHKARIEAEGVIKSATDTAEKAKADIMVSAHEQAGKLIEQTKASLAQEKEATLREIKQDVATLVVSASEKILRGKLDEKKDHQLISESVKGVER